MAWALACLLALVQTAYVLGCSDADSLVVREVLLDLEPGVLAGAGAPDREQVRGVVHQVLEKAHGVKMVAATASGAVLRVRIEGYGPNKSDQATTDSAPKTTLALSIEVLSASGARMDEAGGYRGHALASGTGAIDARSLVREAMKDALSQVLMTKNAADLDSSELVAWLGDNSVVEGAVAKQSASERQRRAVRILGSRRDRMAVEPLSRVLMGAQQELKPLALAALSNIADPSAVDVVIAYADRQPPVLTRQCIEAVRAMGSPRARAWLFTLSTGHPDLDVQQQAAAALAALEDVSTTLPSGSAVVQRAGAAGNEATR